MGSRRIFDGTPEAPGPIVVLSDTPELVLVDKVLKTSYDVVKEVVTHLDDIEGLNQSIYNIHYIIPILDEITVSGSNGIAGGGGLEDYPNLYLDFATLTPHVGAIDPALDLVALHDTSAGATHAVTFDVLRTAVTSDLAGVVALVQSDLADFTAYVDTALTGITHQFNTGISDAVTGLTSTIGAIDGRLAGIDLLNTGFAGDLTGIHGSISGLDTLTAGVASDVAAVLGTVADLQSAATAQEALIVALDVAVADKASSDTVTAIDVRVTETETVLVAQSTRIDSLTSVVDEKAEAAAVDLLTTRVLTAEGINVAQASAITFLNAGLAGAATATALDTLTVRVTATEATNSSQATSITSLTASVGTKASAAALTALTTTVTEIDGEVTSLATAMTSITAGSTPGDIATAMVRMVANSTPAGWSARYGIQVRGGTGDAYKSAGIFFDVNSFSDSSRVVISADKFVIQDGSVYGAPFVVTGGVVYLNDVKISGDLLVNNSIDAAKINSYNLTAANATFGNVNISDANIGTLQVKRLNIDGLAVDTSKIEFDSISGLAFLKGPTKAKRVQVRYSPNLNWGLNTSNTTIASNDVVIASLSKLNNVNPSPVMFNGTVMINAKITDTNSNSFGANHESEYVASLVLQGKQSSSGSGSWRTINTLATASYKAKASDVKAQLITLPVSYVHAPRRSQVGKWDYRVVLKFTHKRGSERSWKAGSYVAASADLTVIYSRR